MFRFAQNFSLSLLIVFFGPVLAYAFPVPFDTVRTYDENAGQTNAVDKTAVGSVSLAAFTASVATAYDNDAGGVINFDSHPAGIIPGITQIDATFGAGASRTIALVSGVNANGNNSSWINAAQGNPVSISGDSILGKHGGTSTEKSNDFLFDIGPITGGGVVSSMGVTYLSRDNNTYNIDVVATFDDASTASLSAVVTGNTTTDDTFFAIEAPAGRYITQFAVIPDGVNSPFGSIDDLAFIVRPIPEPSTLVILFGSLVVASTFTRRQR